MDLEKKLNLKKGMKARVVGKPAGVSLSGVATTPSSNAQAVIAFVKTLADVDKTAGPVVAAAKEDRIAWVAYPKAGQLETDLVAIERRRRLEIGDAQVRFEQAIDVRGRRVHTSSRRGGRRLRRHWSTASGPAPPNTRTASAARYSRSVS